MARCPQGYDDEDCAMFKCTEECAAAYSWTVNGRSGVKIHPIEENELERTNSTTESDPWKL